MRTPFAISLASAKPSMHLIQHDCKGFPKSLNVDNTFAAKDLARTVGNPATPELMILMRVKVLQYALPGNSSYSRWWC
jgi:hypothetical protein